MLIIKIFISLEILYGMLNYSFIYNQLTTFAYAGPIVASIAINGLWAAIGVICVYFYLNKNRFKKYKLLNIITRPFHKTIKKIALKRISKKNKAKK